MSTSLRSKSIKSHPSVKPQLFSIHDPPAVEAAAKKKALSTAMRKAQSHKSKKKSGSSLFPKDTSTRTFFIPEQGQNDPPILSKNNMQNDPNRSTSRSKTVPKPSIPSQPSSKKTNRKTSTSTPTSVNFGTTVPRHSQTMKTPFASQGVVKQTINLRTRPKSATAARYHNPESKWNTKTECDDWNMRTLDTDAQRWAQAPQGDTETEKVEHPLKSTHALSHRKPAVPGQVCYGTNNKGVSLPRRPATTSEGRENRPSASAILNKHSGDLNRNDYGGWEASTNLDEERDNFDGRYRYPQKYAEKDVAKVTEYNNNPPAAQSRGRMKAAWIHTTSSNFAN